MPSAPLPANEAERVAALHALHLLDTPPEERFERLIKLTRKQFHVPIALISLIDMNRQWFKACQGLTVSETPRNISFCSYTILQDDCLVIPDARQDRRFSDNSLVTGPPYVRFYAGYPLHGPGGHKIGTLCILDLVPRQMSEAEKEELRHMGLLVQEEVQKTVADKQRAT